MLDAKAMSDLPCPKGCPLRYGLGVFHYRFGGRDFIGHDGSSGAIVATDVDAGLTIAIVTNGGERDVGNFIEAVIDAIDLSMPERVGRDGEAGRGPRGS